MVRQTHVPMRTPLRHGTGCYRKNQYFGHPLSKRWLQFEGVVFEARYPFLVFVFCIWQGKPKGQLNPCAILGLPLPKSRCHPDFLAVKPRAAVRTEGNHAQHLQPPLCSAGFARLVWLLRLFVEWYMTSRRFSSDVIRHVL